MKCSLFTENEVIYIYHKLRQNLSLRSVAWWLTLYKNQHCVKLILALNYRLHSVEMVYTIPRDWSSVWFWSKRSLFRWSSTVDLIHAGHFRRCKICIIRGGTLWLHEKRKSRLLGHINFYVQYRTTVLSINVIETDQLPYLQQYLGFT